MKQLPYDPLKDLQPEIRKNIEDTRAQVGGGTAGEFGAFIRGETATWARVVKAARIEPQ
jgi:hypothetical protein